MHYKLQAMQKILAGVGTSHHFAQRPMLQKFKQLADYEAFDEASIAFINSEIENIENIIRQTKAQNKISSKQVKGMMSNINNQMIEALELYRSAWHLMANSKQIIKTETEEAKETEETETEEAKETEETETEEVKKTEETGKEEVKDNMNGYEPYDYRKIVKAVNMAEDAETMLMEAERLVANVLNDNPMEG